MGMLAGVSDLILLHDGQAYALELKTEKGRATEVQDEFLVRFTAAGGIGYVARGLDAAIRSLEAWGILK